MKAIAQKMLEIQREIIDVPKTGYNSGQKYEFRTIDDVLVTVRNAMNKFGVVCSPVSQLIHEWRAEEETSKRGARMVTRVVIQATYRFTDSDSGEYIEVQALGEGFDSGDKGIYKALTGAQKYALTQAFSIPCDGMDPEDDQYDDDLKLLPGGRR